MSGDALLLDVGNLSALTTDHALEFICKAHSTPPDDASIWQPHHDPFITNLIEVVYGALTMRMWRISSELTTIVRELGSAEKAFAPSQAEVQYAIAKLNGKHPRDYSVDDWMTLIDWLIMKYLPDTFLRTEAEYLAVRAAVAGKIKAAAPDAKPGPSFDAQLPTSITTAAFELGMTHVERAMLEIATARAAEAITNVGEATRHRIKQIVINHLEGRISGDRGATAKRLENNLFEEFSMLNRDWRRVAITEAGNAQNEGVISALPVGARVRRFEAYQGACKFCEHINGMVFTVVDPAKEKKDGWKEVWVGKTNYGRSASPRKRVGNELVEREPSELWWPAAGVQHPWCRGGWTPETSTAGRDSKTVDFVNQLLAKHGLVKEAA